MGKSSLRREVDEVDIEEPERDKKGKIVRDAEGNIKYRIVATLIVEEPDASKQDEYMMLNARVGIEAEKKKKGLKDIGRKVLEFSNEKHTEKEKEKFSIWLKTEMERMSRETFTDNREIIEFIVGKVSDDVWKKIMPRHRQDIIDKFEKMCDIERITKNVLELIPEEIIKKIYEMTNK